MARCPWGHLYLSVALPLYLSFKTLQMTLSLWVPSQSSCPLSQKGPAPSVFSLFCTLTEAKTWSILQCHPVRLPHFMNEKNKGYREWPSGTMATRIRWSRTRPVVIWIDNHDFESDFLKRNSVCHWMKAKHRISEWQGQMEHWRSLLITNVKPVRSEVG